MVEKEKDDENKAEVDGNEEVGKQNNKKMQNFSGKLTKQCFSAGIMQQSIISKCIRQDGHATDAAEVGHPESWEIYNVNRIHGECNNFRFAELRNQSSILGPKVHRRPAGGRKNPITRNGDDFLLAQRLGNQLQENHQS